MAVTVSPWLTVATVVTETVIFTNKQHILWDVAIFATSFSCIYPVTLDKVNPPALNTFFKSWNNNSASENA